MKHVSILLPRGQSSLSNIEGTHQILTMMNTLAEQQGRPPFFLVQLIGLEKEIPQASGSFKMYADLLIDEVDETDLIIIPALHSDQSLALELNKEFIPWIVDQHAKGAEVASLCIGAFLLAETGLLDGRKCTTHWTFMEEFKSRYPQCNLLPENIMTEDKGIYTSGGAYAYLSLIMYLIEKYAGREMAVLASKMFSIDLNRNSQSPFIMFIGQKKHKDQEVLNVQEYIEGRYNQKITLAELAEMASLSKRSLERRFKKATGNTVVEYVQRVRVEAAKKCLETTPKNVNEVMYDVGYSDEKSFRSLFKRITGLSPVRYRNKYNHLYTGA